MVAKEVLLFFRLSLPCVRLRSVTERATRSDCKAETSSSRAWRAVERSTRRTSSAWNFRFVPLTIFGTHSARRLLLCHSRSNDKPALFWSRCERNGGTSTATFRQKTILKWEKLEIPVLC